MATLQSTPPASDDAMTRSPTQCNETLECDPHILASQALYVLKALSKDPARDALGVLLGIASDKLCDTMWKAEKDCPSVTTNRLQESSIDLLQILAVLECILQDKDDPAIEGVKTILQLSKLETDKLATEYMAKGRSTELQHG